MRDVAVTRSTSTHIYKTPSLWLAQYKCSMDCTIFGGVNSFISSFINAQEKLHHTIKGCGQLDVQLHEVAGEQSNGLEKVCLQNSVSADTSNRSSVSNKKKNTQGSCQNQLSLTSLIAK